MSGVSRNVLALTIAYVRLNILRERGGDLKDAEAQVRLLEKRVTRAEAAKRRRRALRRKS